MSKQLSSKLEAVYESKSSDDAAHTDADISALVNLAGVEEKLVKLVAEAEAAEAAAAAAKRARKEEEALRLQEAALRQHETEEVSMFSSPAWLTLYMPRPVLGRTEGGEKPNPNR